MSTFEEYCAQEGKSRSEMIAAMFAEYGSVIEYAKRYALANSAEVDDWIRKNHSASDQKLSEQITSRCVQVSTVAAILVFFMKLDKFGVSEQEIMEALSKCTDDPMTFLAITAISQSGGVAALKSRLKEL